MYTVTVYPSDQCGRSAPDCLRPLAYVGGRLIGPTGLQLRQGPLRPVGQRRSAGGADGKPGKSTTAVPPVRAQCVKNTIGADLDRPTLGRTRHLQGIHVRQNGTSRSATQRICPLDAPRASEEPRRLAEPLLQFACLTRQVAHVNSRLGDPPSERGADRKFCPRRQRVRRTVGTSTDLMGSASAQEQQRGQGVARMSVTHV